VAVPRGIPVTPPKRGCCDASIKRLEEGYFPLPSADGQRALAGAHGLVLRPAELAMLLDGIDLGNVKRQKRY